MTGRYAEGRPQRDRFAGHPQHRERPDRAPVRRPVGRWTVAVLVGTAAVTETLLALTAGATAAGAGAVLFTVAALVTVRYAAGAESEDGGPGRAQRMVEQRTAGLGDWRPVVEGALSEREEDVVLLCSRLQRLYDARLTERHGISLHHAPEAAAALVGPGIWQLIEPHGTFRGPLPPALLHSAVDGLRTV
ncbi:hypothetical protein ACIRBX_19930 [Kitasatospora sp. NPDC096147]|uniref:hypothetical protein n=1 Tax=Kitasatospora sp. NPDC096147 TaxID=3364093 RepID=UPI003815D6D3